MKARICLDTTGRLVEIRAKASQLKRVRLVRRNDEYIVFLLEGQIKEFDSRQGGGP